MKIYAMALAIFIFVGFTSAVTNMGVFGNIYSHTNEVNMTINESDIEGIRQISNDGTFSIDDFTQLNPEQGGVFSFLKTWKLFIKIIDQTLNVDKLIMEYTPPSSKALVQPLASFFGKIMWLIYGVGALSFLRKYRVG